MRKPRILFTFALLLVAAASFADDPTFTSPVPATWIVSTCENWNTASAALIMADGDPFVLALPTNSVQHPWIVVKRVASGSIYIPDDAPFLIETFESMSAATSRYAALESSRIPMLLTTALGETLVIYAREPQRRRSTRH